MVWLCPECNLTMPDRRSEWVGRPEGNGGSTTPVARFRRIAKGTLRSMESDCSGEHPDSETEDSDGEDEDDSWGHAHGPYL